MADIPSQISFEQMLSHMFPGLFLALTIFMVLDIWSSFNFTSIILKDITALIAFAGLLFIVGTILGVLIDSFHHDILQPYYFNRFGNKIFHLPIDKKPWYNHIIKNTDIKTGYISYIDIIEYFKELHNCGKCPQQDTNEINKQQNKNLCKFIYPENLSPTKIYYFFDIDNLDKYISIYEHLRRSIFHYYEFYINTFVCMIPFTFVAPIYFHEILGIDATFMIIIALSIVACLCLYFSYTTYQEYMAALYFAYCSCHKTRRDKRISSYGEKGA
jgi:hypothetical protein